MGGPWEDFQETETKDTVKEVAGPWSDFQENIPMGGERGRDPITYRLQRKVKNERHPDVSLVSRALYKNFAVNPQQGLEYMEREHPDLEFDRDEKGDMIVKRADEKEWLKVDPENKAYSPELMDIVDVGYDIPAATAETMAATAGGVAGATLGLGGGPAAPVTVPAGAMAGAMGAGAMAGATTEGIRQSIGKATGVAKEYDPGMIGWSATFGAAAPLLLGTGGASKHFLKSGLKKKLISELGEEGAEKAMKQVINAQRSVLTRGVGKMVNASTPHLASWASNYTPAAMKNLRERVASGLMSVDPSEVPRAFVSDLKAAFKAKKDALGEVYGKSLKSLDVEVDATNAEKPLYDLLEKYRLKAEEAVPGFEQRLKDAGEESVGFVDELGRPLKAADDLAEKSAKDLEKIDVQNYLHLKDTISQYTRGGGDTNLLQGKDIVGYMDNLNDLTKIRKNVNVQGMSKVDQDLVRVSKQVVDDVNKSLDDTLMGQEFKNVKGQYNKLYEIGDTVKTYADDPKKAEGHLRNLQSQANFERRAQMEEMGKALGVDVPEYANDMYTLSQFGRPASAAKYVGGSSATAQEAALGLGAGYAGYTIGQEVPGMSPFLTAAIAGLAGRKLASPANLRRYAEAGNKVRQGGQLMQNMSPIPQGAINLWEQVKERK